MTDSIEELARRLVVGHKRDGRAVYDEQVKTELVLACGQPGASIARLARECGINANPLSRWIREHYQRIRQPPATTNAAALTPVSAPSAFVALAIEPSPPVVPVEAVARPTPPSAHAMQLQATLPNGIVIDLSSCERAALSAVLDILGGLRCSVSTNG
ncbi:transposase [Comamonadaceae bacterium PP-2]